MKAAFTWQGMARIYSRGRDLARMPVLASCGTDADPLAAVALNRELVGALH